jgi:4-hydroxybenzoate polyprenyltransferase
VAALRASAASHVVALILLISLGVAASLSWPYYVGLVITAGLLVAEHRLVDADDLSQLNIAFFHVNSAISIILFASVLAAMFTRSI